MTGNFVLCLRTFGGKIRRHLIVWVENCKCLNCMLSRDKLIQCKLAIKSKFEITWWKVKSQLKPATIINFYTVKEHVIDKKDPHHGMMMTVIILMVMVMVMMMIVMVICWAKAGSGSCKPSICSLLNLQRDFQQTAQCTFSTQIDNLQQKNSYRIHTEYYFLGGNELRKSNLKMQRHN